MARKEIRNLLEEGVVIHCKTPMEDSRVRNILHSYDFKWADTSPMSFSYWNNYKEDTCIDPFDCRFARIEYYKERGYKIMSTDDFIKIVESNK
jgi:hypothetical protein